MKTLTDFRKTVETGVDPRLSISETYLKNIFRLVSHQVPSDERDSLFVPGKYELDQTEPRDHRFLCGCVLYYAVYQRWRASQLFTFTFRWVEQQR